MDTAQTITHLGLCAGYGGIELGLHRVIRNLRTVALCEIEAFACANLVAKMEAGLMDAAPIWTDLKSFPWAEFRGRVDIITGGYPCQPFSAAGKRLGTEDPRHLWPFIADGIRILRPKLCFFDNVEGHISLGLREVIGELESIGYKAAWGIFSAAEVGAPHQRKRVFILAVSNSLGGATGLSRSLAWNEGVAGVSDNGGGEGTIGIPNTSHNRLEEHPQCSIQPNKSRGGDGDFGRVHSCPWPSQLANAGRIEPQGWGCVTQGQQSGAGRIPRGESAPCDDQVWPSRPGEPQYAWEPPRVVGNAPQRQDHGREPRDMGIEAGQGRCGDHAADGTGEVLGHANSPRPQERQGQRGSGIQGIDSDGGEDAERQAQPSLGGDADGSAGGLGYAELQVTCDNRTDELRLLGNGVVPATAERAFRILMEELI